MKLASAYILMNLSGGDTPRDLLLFVMSTVYLVVSELILELVRAGEGGGRRFRLEDPRPRRPRGGVRRAHVRPRRLCLQVYHQTVRPAVECVLGACPSGVVRAVCTSLEVHPSTT